MNISSRNRRTLMGGTYENQTVTGDFRNALSYRSIYRSIIFRECNIGKAEFSGSEFFACSFVSCNLGMASFSACQIDTCTFEDCDLDQSKFDGSIIKMTMFAKGRAQYASFCGTTLTDVMFDMDMHGADLRFSSAVNVDYGDSNLWGASINVSCASFLGHKASPRQLELFLSLLAGTKGNEELRSNVRSLLSVESVKMMSRLTET